MEKRTIKIAIKITGAAQASKKVKAAKAEVDRFYSLGKKYGIPRSTLTKMLILQVENMIKPKLVINQLPKVEYRNG